MKRYVKNFLLVLLVLSFISLGCASTKKTVTKETKPAKAVKNTKTAKVAKASTAAKQDPNAGNAAVQETTAAPKESAVTKSNVQDKAIDAMIKKYSEKKPVIQGPRPAPDFKLQDIFYDTYSLQSYKDNQQPVLLFFWATWCPYCQNELVSLHNRYPTLTEDGLEVLAIDVGETMQQVSDYVKEINPGFKVLVDTDAAVSGTYRVAGVPTYVLVDKKGMIVFQDNIFPDGYKNLLAAQETAK